MVDQHSNVNLISILKAQIFQISTLGKQKQKQKKVQSYNIRKISCWFVSTTLEKKCNLEPFLVDAAVTYKQKTLTQVMG